MRKVLEYITDTFTMLGCARASSELHRLGRHEEARNLMNHYFEVSQKRNAK